MTDATSTAGLPGVLRLGGAPLPVLDRARLYVCGITPYDVTHLGHAATFVWVDTLVRVLGAIGTEVAVCRNVTDVDDVLSVAARRAGTRYDEFAAVRQFYFDRDMRRLAVRQPAFEPRAHSYVNQVMRIAQALLDADRAYVSAGSVYFRGAAAVAGAGLGEGDAGREEAVRLLTEYGGHPDDPAKRDPFDSPVWQASGSGRPRLGQPVGAGPTRLACRVRGHGVEHVRPRRRRACRRQGSRVPAPRVRVGDGRSGDGGGPVRPALDARGRGHGSAA